MKTYKKSNKKVCQITYGLITEIKDRRELMKLESKERRETPVYEQPD